MHSHNAHETSQEWQRISSYSGTAEVHKVSRLVYCLLYKKSHTITYRNLGYCAKEVRPQTVRDSFKSTRVTCHRVARSVKNVFGTTANLNLGYLTVTYSNVNIHSKRFNIRRKRLLKT